MIYLITNNKPLFNSYNSIEFCSIKFCLEYLDKLKLIEVDTETEGFDPYTKKLLTLQLGHYENQFVIDLSTVDINNFKNLLEDSTKTFILQNAKFDLGFFYHHRIILSNVWDTYLAECVINTGIERSRKALDFLAKKYLGVKLDKSIRGEIHKGLSERVIKYAADDVKYLTKIKKEQDKLLDKYDLQKALLLDNEFVKVLAYTEYCGIYLDRTAWENKIKEDKLRLNKALERLNKWIVDKDHTEWIDPQMDLFNPETNVIINWNSTQQVVKLLNQYNVDTKTPDKETGEIKDSSDAKILKPQKDKTDLIPLYLEYKEYEKECSTYGDKFLKFINPISGRLHGEYMQLMSTGRMSSGGGDSKINFQNIPADPRVRKCFTASNGNVLINSDFSGQESVVFANWSKDENIIKFYEEGLSDMHSFIASKIYSELEGLSLNEIKTNHKDKRQIAKSAGFAIQYGGEGITIAENLGISTEEGEDIYNSYFKAFPGVKNYFEKCQKEAIKNGYVTFNSISNRKSFIEYYEDFKRISYEITPEFWDEYRYNRDNETKLFEEKYKPLCRNYFSKKGAIERKALNFPIQGSSAEITKLAGVYIFRELLKNNLLFTVYISNIVHDEFVLESPKNISKKIAKIVEECMCKSGDVFCKIVPLKAEAVISNYWEH